MQFTEQSERYLAQTEAALDAELPLCAQLPQAELLRAMRYSLLGGGKRIRAQLVLGFCEGLGGEPARALPAAAAVEMVHAYSLIHDDLPCMDNDLLRRGKPTCHIAFGEATALLAGDALLTRAFEALSSPQNIALVGECAALRQIRALAGAAGFGGMVGGQTLDVEPPSGGRSLDALEQTDALKTGALIRASAVMGCLAAGADEAAQRTASDYAGLIGLAFQMVDDVLDAVGDAEQMGKQPGRDRKLHKTTYQTLLGSAQAREAADRLHAEALLKLEALPLRTSFLHDLTQALAGRTR